MILFGEINVAAFDWPWSGVHLLSGSLIGIFIGLRAGIGSKIFWWLGFGLLILWEIVEITLHLLDRYAHNFVSGLKDAVQGFAFAPETWTNRVGDLLIGLFGLMVFCAIVNRIQVQRISNPPEIEKIS